MTYLPDLWTETESREFIRDGMLPSNEVWVAEEDGRVVGFAGLGDGKLRHLWVEPAAQNRGFGTALLAKAKERRPDGFQLWVFQKNTGARRFYERHGFTLVKLTDGRDNQERSPTRSTNGSPGTSNRRMTEPFDAPPDERSSEAFIPNRSMRPPFESYAMRIVATIGIVAIGTALAAILSWQDVRAGSSVSSCPA